MDDRYCLFGADRRNGDRRRFSALPRWPSLSPPRSDQLEPARSEPNDFGFDHRRSFWRSRPSPDCDLSTRHPGDLKSDIAKTVNWPRFGGAFSFAPPWRASRRLSPEVRRHAGADVDGGSVETRRCHRADGKFTGDEAIEHPRREEVRRDPSVQPRLSEVAGLGAEGRLPIDGGELRSAEVAVEHTRGRRIADPLQLAAAGEGASFLLAALPDRMERLRAPCTGPRSRLGLPDDALGRRP